MASAVGAYVTAKHRTVHDVLGDFTRFGQHLAPWPNFHRLNPPEHRRLGRLVSRAFTPKSISALVGEMDRVSAELLSRGPTDFDAISDYAYHLPARIIADMIGVPHEDAALWHAWLVRMGQFNFQNPFTAKDPEAQRPIIEDAQAANREQADYFVDIIGHRRQNRGNDIVTRLIDARDNDDKLSDEEVLYILVLLLQGGLHTTVHQIGNTVRALLDNPAQLAAVRADPGLIPGTIEEALRYRGTLHTEIRVTREPVTVEGVAIAEGENVITVHAAANRDPAVFPGPDQFDVRRTNAKDHLAFGFGTHYCIGAPLARAELTVAVRDFIALPGLRFAGEPQPDDFFRVRGLATLPVEWDPS